MTKNSTAEQSDKEHDLRENIARIKHKLIILSGKGGVGKSTMAVNIAYGLAQRGKRVGILDIDIHGPSIAKLLGIEGKAITAGSDKRVQPIKVDENLYAITIASLLRSPDDAIIWRGPLKTHIIRQFLQDFEWPSLDYLIIDSPPGTGDEPLSAAQIIGKLDGSIVVTTSQDLALLDVRKSINFSRKVNVPVLGLLVNMSAFRCPHCGKIIDIFHGTAVQKAAKDFDIEILGTIPIDENIVEMSDNGKPYIKYFNQSEPAKEMIKVVDKIISKVEKSVS
ncbi:MAG: P-loop NTPase [Candidatus Cloacimonadia bacterium]